MRLFKILAFSVAVALIAGNAWGQQSRSGSVVKSAAGKSSQVATLASHRQAACSSCDAGGEYYDVGSSCNSCDSCSSCNRCTPCFPRILPAIAGGIHAVADRVACGLSCLLPCHGRCSSCQPLWDNCCSNSCGQQLWTPCYRNCSGACGGSCRGCGEVMEGQEMMEETHAPTPLPDKAPGGQAMRRPKTPASLPSSTQRVRSTEPRRVTSISVQKKSAPTPATPRSLSIESEDVEEVAVKEVDSVAKKTIRRTSGESPTVRLAPVNPLR